MSDAPAPPAPAPPATGRVGRNIASNYLALGAQVAFVLLTVPYIVGRRGAEAFGAFAIVLAVAGYVRLLDLGLGPAIARFVARARDPRELNGIVAAGLAVLGLAALLGLAAGLAVAATAPAIFGDTPGLALALGAASVSTALQVPLNAFTNVLYGLERIVERNAMIVARVVGAALGLVIAIELGGGLAAFVIAMVSAELAVMVGQAVYCLVRVPGLRPRPRDITRARLRELAGFSVAVLGLSLATQIALYTDGLVVGAAIGVAAVAVYTVAARLVEGAAQLLAQISDVFMPIFARLHAGADEARNRQLVDAGTRATLVLGFPLVALLIGLGEPIVGLWVGEGFEASWPVLAMLAGGLAFGAPLRFAVLWSIGAGRHGRVAAYAIGDALANLALSIALVGPLGIEGVALATLIALAISNGFLIPRLIFRELGLSLWACWVRPLLTAAALVAPFALLMRLVLTPALERSDLAMLGVAALWLALGTALVAAVLLTGAERRAVAGRLGLARRAQAA